jgi:hypothetical protein
MLTGRRNNRLRCKQFVVENNFVKVVRDDLNVFFFLLSRENRTDGVLKTLLSI